MNSTIALYSTDNRLAVEEYDWICPICSAGNYVKTYETKIIKVYCANCEAEHPAQVVHSPQVEIKWVGASIKLNTTILKMNLRGLTYKQQLYRVNKLRIILGRQLRKRPGQNIWESRNDGIWSKTNSIVLYE